VDNIKNYSFFIDYYNDVEIKITNSKNSDGLLYTDENGSFIGYTFQVGTNYIYPKSNTTNVLLYDDFTFAINSRFLKKKGQYVRYKLGATKTTITNIDYATKKLNRALTNRSVFKVFVNGQEATSYTVDTTGVTLTGDSVELLTNINDYVAIIDYPSIQTPSGTVIFEYLAPANTTPTQSQIETYLDGLLEITEFDDIQINKSKQQTKINNLYQYINNKRYTNKEFTLQINMFKDYRAELLNKRFRILFYDYTDKIMRIYNNCLYDGSESKSYKRFKNDTTLNIEFEDEYMVVYDGEDVAYGEGEYGLEAYGGVFGVNEI
jgi:hypothetical protein